MSDKELLELAAKAAGIKVNGLADKFVAQHNYGKNGLCIRNDRGGDSLWNPLTDDGDALRLAVKLGIQYKRINVGIQAYDGTIQAVFESLGNDPYAATRRAIVRAAAEIGKDMK